MYSVMAFMTEDWNDVILKFISRMKYQEAAYQNPNGGPNREHGLWPMSTYRKLAPWFPATMKTCAMRLMSCCQKTMKNK